MDDFKPPPTVERSFNKAFGILVGLGLGLSHNFVLEVRDRRTGGAFRTVPAGSPETAFRPLVDRYPAFQLEAKP